LKQKQIGKLQIQTSCFFLENLKLIITALDTMKGKTKKKQINERIIVLFD